MIILLLLSLLLNAHAAGHGCKLVCYIPTWNWEHVTGLGYYRQYILVCNSHDLFVPIVVNFFSKF